MNIGRYRIIKEIGRGSMGVVYQAEDPNLDLVVALKVLKQELLTDDPFVKRFISEAKALGRVDHPNIVRVFNVDRDGDTIYIAMEFIEGESLSSRMAEESFSPEAIAEFGATVATALDSAHKKGIVHRDIKPSNIVFKADGSAKITDFGIAHIEGPSRSQQTLAGEILGTPAYMSPEQVMSRPVDGRSDIFSLGIILYELATGTRPFSGEGITGIFAAITGEEPPEAVTKNPNIPKTLSHVIMTCLRKDPAKRYADGLELAKSLRDSVRAAEPRDEKRGKRTWKAFLPAVLLGVALLCAAAAALYFFLPVSPVPKPSVEAVSHAMLTVESSPAGAQIFVDGVLKGVAPASISLVMGKHEIRLSMPSHYAWEAQVEIKDKDPAPLFVRLVPINEK